jgi:CBS domain containing-hemolysin-like protein
MIGPLAPWAMLAAAVIAGFAAVAAKSLREFSRRRLQEYCAAAGQPDRFRAIIVEREPVALSIECLRAVGGGACAVFGFLWAVHAPPGAEAGPAQIIARLLVTAVLLLFAVVWGPNAVRRLYAEAFLNSSWRTLSVVAVVLWPLGSVGRWLDLLLHAVAGKKPTSPAEDLEDEIRTIVHEGERGGLLEGDAREMIESVIELRDADAAEIMTPRTYLSAMPVGHSLQEALAFAATSGHSRIPVFDKSRDDITGLLHVKDLLVQLSLPPEKRVQRLSELLRPVHFVPETKPVDALLQEFQRTGNHMAVVLDEFGGVSGVVTIEDVLEEIVGEIIDEHDDDLIDGVRRLGDDTAEVQALVRIDEVNDRLAIRLPESDDFDTVGGLVFNRLGRIPRPGESIVEAGFKLTVVDVTRRRIERIRIERDAPAAPSSVISPAATES